MRTKCCSHMALADGCHRMNSPLKDVAMSQRPDKAGTHRAMFHSANPWPGLNVKPPFLKSMVQSSREEVA